MTRHSGDKRLWPVEDRLKARLPVQTGPVELRGQEASPLESAGQAAGDRPPEGSTPGEHLQGMHGMTTDKGRRV
jgi:hypothetical protein